MRIGQLGFVLLLLLLAPGKGSGQACAQPNCQDPWVTEMRLGRFFGFSGEDRSPFLITIHAGYLRAFGDNQAIGGGALIGANDIDGFVGFEGRYRRWLSPETAVDVGLGIVPFAGQSLETPHIMGNVAVNHGTVGVFFHMQPLKDLNPTTDEFTETETVSAIGLQLNGGLGRKAALILLGVVGLAWASLSS